MQVDQSSLFADAISIYSMYEAAYYLLLEEQKVKHSCCFPRAVDTRGNPIDFNILSCLAIYIVFVRLRQFKGLCASDFHRILVSVKLYGSN